MITDHELKDRYKILSDYLSYMKKIKYSEFDLEPFYLCNSDTFTFNDLEIYQNTYIQRSDIHDMYDDLNRTINSKDSISGLNTYINTGQLDTLTSTVISRCWPEMISFCYDHIYTDSPYNSSSYDFDLSWDSKYKYLFTIHDTDKNVVYSANINGTINQVRLKCYSILE